MRKTREQRYKDLLRKFKMCMLIEAFIIIVLCGSFKIENNNLQTELNNLLFQNSELLSKNEELNSTIIDLEQIVIDCQSKIGSIEENNEPIISIYDYYTKEEVNMLAKLVWGEARGIESYEQKASVIWVVLNRIDDTRFPDTITEVVTAPNQFTGYNYSHPVETEFVEMAENVLCAYVMEKYFDNNSKRDLPSDYLFFHGDGELNYFRKEYKSTEYFYFE